MSASARKALSPFVKALIRDMPGLERFGDWGIAGGLTLVAGIILGTGYLIAYLILATAQYLC